MKIKLLSVLALAVFAISCSSKDKKNEAGSTSSPSGDSSISAQDMSFDTAGSDSGKIAGLYTINFPYDSDTLDASNKDKLKENAKWIKTNANVTMQIEGHCDARGSIEYNLALGERRAKSVKNYLVSLGVDSNRLSIISYGKEKLLDSSDADSAHAKNRRANFLPLAN